MYVYLILFIFIIIYLISHFPDCFQLYVKTLNSDAYILKSSFHKHSTFIYAFVCPCSNMLPELDLSLIWQSIFACKVHQALFSLKSDRPEKQKKKFFHEFVFNFFVFHVYGTRQLIAYEYILALKAPITTAADDIYFFFLFIFFFWRK